MLGGESRQPGSGCDLRLLEPRCRGEIRRVDWEMSASGFLGTPIGTLSIMMDEPA